MSDELTDLLDTAIYKEIASQAFYVAGQSKTEDPGAKALMKELAEEELKHLRSLSLKFVLLLVPIGYLHQIAHFT